MSEATADSQPGYSVQRGWRTLALAGGVIGLLGILAIALPFVAGISVTLGLGALLVVAAVVHAAHAVTARGWKGSLWQVVLAVVSVIAGLVLLLNPIVALVTLTLLLVAYLAVDGIAELYMAMRMAGQPGRGTVALSGVISLVLASLLWIGFPTDAAWAIGLLVGISLFMTGVSMAAVAFAGRKIDDAAAPVSEPRGA